jgi:sugar/nucleoside kinase (ribokinase family)
MVQICNWRNVAPDRLRLEVDKRENEIVLGIDGIVDNVWTVVKQRIDRQNTETLDSMREFGERIRERSGTSLGMEILPRRRNAGGLTSNTGLAIGRLGVRASLIGTYGVNEIHPVFDELAAYCNLFSLGSPATCQLFEFHDGKLMMAHVQELLDIDWDLLVQVFGLSKLREIFSKAKVVSIGYWSNMPSFDETMQDLCEEVFLANPPEHLFFDFADIAKRTTDELKATLRVLGSINNSIPVVLSLNDAEARHVYECCGETFSHEPQEVAESAATVRRQVGIEEIVVHTPTYAVTANAEGTYLLVQDFCKQPVRTVGAGDTFNAGYMVGLLNHWSVPNRLAVANSTTSFLVRNGYPPNPSELAGELQRIVEKLGY